MTEQGWWYRPTLHIYQSDTIPSKPGRELMFMEGNRIIIPMYRPSLRFPYTEAIAAREGIDLWYFDRNKWPEQVRVDISEYLGLPSG